METATQNATGKHHKNGPSRLTKALDKAAPGLPWGMLYFPPAWFLLPFMIAAQFDRMRSRITPMHSERLLDMATSDERQQLADVICKAKGRPTRYALAKLGARLQAQAEQARVQASLARLEQKCS